VPLLTSDDWRRCAQTLYHEAELLDDRRYRDWLELVADEIDYRILNRTTVARESGAAASDPGNYALRCGRNALEARVLRVDTGFAFSEDPPATTRRFISNIRATRSDDRLTVKTNILLFRARWENSAFVSAERDDIWLDAGGRLRLARRWIRLDQATLPVETLGAII
jgi:ethylbenzene dioxygenase beta subunit